MDNDAKTEVVMDNTTQENDNKSIGTSSSLVLKTQAIVIENDVRDEKEGGIEEVKVNADERQSGQNQNHTAQRGINGQHVHEWSHGCKCDFHLE